MNVPTPIVPHPPYDQQMAAIGRLKWSVARLVELARGLPVMDIPMAHLNVYNTYENLTLRQMAGHIRAVMDADMNYPIILDEDGEIMDGRHRVLKALVEGLPTIKAVRFLENPDPCEIEPKD